MQKVFKKFFYPKGFTLVELMVVVAIIGILSAVAIPNFRRYQAKSKTSEAKLQLSSLYASQTSVQAEFDTYVTCLDIIGFDPRGEFANRYFSVGFAAGDSASNTNASAAGLTDCGSAAGSWLSDASTTKVVFGYGAGRGMGAQKATANMLDTKCKSTSSPNSKVDTNGTVFRARACGYIIPTNDPNQLDTWDIDENKVVTHEKTGY